MSDAADEDRMRERLIGLLAKMDRIREAAKPLRGVTWEHGDECAHRYCPNPNDCAQGGDDLNDADCEAPGHPCACTVASTVALLTAIDGAP